MITAERIAEIRRLHRPCACPPHAAVTDLLAVLDDVTSTLAEVWHDKSVPMHVCADLDQFATMALGVDITRICAERDSTRPERLFCVRPIAHHPPHLDSVGRTWS